MPVGYSRTIEFTCTGGAVRCVELPMQPRGTLKRLIIEQVAGGNESAEAVVYDRRGACSQLNDLNVDASGEVATVTDSGGSTLVTFDSDESEGLPLQVGDVIEIKGCDVSTYNTTHTVTAVNSDTEVVTDQTYTSDGTGGYWQTEPFIAGYAPGSHLVHAVSITAGTASKEFDSDKAYENRDNQSETMRTRHSGLWLELTPGGNGDTTWQVSYTSESDML